MKTKSHLNKSSGSKRAHRIKLCSPTENDTNTATAVTIKNKPNSSDVSPETVRKLIVAECRSVEKMLLAKNLKYKNSAIRPVRIFSKASSEEQILVRLDDKLSRISCGLPDDEDVILDTIGYLILLRVLRKVS